MRRNELVIAVLVAILFAGCASPETRARWAAEERAQQAAQREAYWSNLRALCSRYGYREGTDAFAQCMQREALQQDERQRAAQQAEQEFWKKKSCQAGNKWDCDVQPATTKCKRNIDGTVTCVTE